jgi:PHP family Zn ribbon phosphoesterase
MEKWRKAEAKHWYWVDVDTVINCPCGEQITYNMERVGVGYVNCPKCGQVYRVHVEVKLRELAEETDENERTGV